MSFLVAVETCDVRKILFRFRFVVVLRFPVVVLDKWFLLWFPRFRISILVRFVVSKASLVLRRRYGLVVVVISQITIGLSILFHPETIVILDDEIYHLLPFYWWMDVRCDH